VLKLVEEGRLDLDEPVFAILDDLVPPEGKNIDPRVYDITARHLLEHAGGWDSANSFDPMFMSREIAQEMGTEAPADCTAIARYMLGQPLDFEPGSKYSYSNFGYCVLGLVIEERSGQSYEAYVRQNILVPAGIENMHLGRTKRSEKWDGEVSYYDDAGAPPVESVFLEDQTMVPRPYGGFYLEAMASHGGWVGSAADLARFAYAVDGTNQESVLRSDTLETMLSRPFLPEWDDSEAYYALGWRVRTSPKLPLWHTGSLPGASAVIYLRGDGFAWAALFNANPDTSSDEFVVDVIVSMGRAAVMDEIFWGAVLMLFILIGIVFLMIRRKKRKMVGIHHQGVQNE
jgi:N-acyl-D-amino-acid deacylase